MLILLIACAPEDGAAFDADTAADPVETRDRDDDASSARSGATKYDAEDTGYAGPTITVSGDFIDVDGVSTEGAACAVQVWDLADYAPADYPDPTGSPLDAAAVDCPEDPGGTTVFEVELAVGDVTEVGIFGDLSAEWSAEHTGRAHWFENPERVADGSAVAVKLPIYHPSTPP